jgi:phosphoadenosine phosphosulfate reductase
MPTPVTIARRTPPAPERSALTAAAEALETASAADVVRWAWDRYGSSLVVTSSFQDSVLIDVVASVAPRTEVVFLDTQYHFPETLAYVEQVRERYGLNLRVVRPRVAADDRWRDDPDGCCQVRKVEPLRRALAGKSAWVTGLRRADGPTRASIPVVGHDARTGTVKVNPLATWSDDDVADYVRRRELLVHPLTSQGYASIGCWPCTRPVDDGDDPRAGRWPGMGKTECGLHR